MNRMIKELEQYAIAPTVKIKEIVITQKERCDNCKKKMEWWELMMPIDDTDNRYCQACYYNIKCKDNSTSRRICGTRLTNRWVLG